MIIDIEQSRKSFFSEEFEKEYFKEIIEILHRKKEEGERIFPLWGQIFHAFNTTPFDDVKVVILWQDPYHGLWQAHGLSFSVPEGVKIPPSLKNIFKELVSEFWWEIPNSWNLTHRAKQWVLLLNSILTVQAQTPASHKKIWRETFTDAVIKKISQEKKWVVFMLWWKFAQGKEELIDQSKHYILQAPHPSPFSAYKWFFWCDHFKKCNAWLNKKRSKEIIRL